MKVSIIIPCYNSEKYLPDCLDSVLAQSETDFEVILVDDGSRDATLAVANAYAAKDARIHVYHQENAGVCAARNLALSYAQGEWVTFVDSDDLLVRDALSLMLSATQGETDLVVLAHETFDERGNRTPVWPQTRWMDLPIEARRHAAALRLIEGDSVLNIMCNKLHRRALLEKQGLRLVQGIAIAEDALFNLEAVLCAREIAYVNRVAYRYRTHSQSATQTRAAGEFAVHRPWFVAMRQMLERLGQMETFYPAYVDSVVLRLYKDGGPVGVLREFGRRAKPVLGLGGMRKEKMGMAAKALLCLCSSGAYPLVYPFILPVQIIQRKISAAAFLLRSKKEKPE